MGNNDNRLTCKQTGECLLNHSLVLHIQARRRLVQQHDRRIFEQRAGDGDALALAARKPGAVLADHGVVALRHAAHELVAVGGTRGRKHFLFGGIATPEADVSHHRVVKEQHVLEHNGVVSQQHLGINARNIHATHGDRAFGGIPKARGQAAHRRLTGTRRTDQCRDLAFLGGKAHIGKNFLAGASVAARTIAKCHVIEHHVMTHGFKLLAAPCHGLLHDGAHALGRRLGGKQLGHQHQCLIEGRIDAAHHEQEGKHHQKVDLAGGDHGSARDQRGGNPQAQDGKGGVDQKPIGELAFGGLALLGIDHGVEPLKIMSLLVGGADLAHAVKRLLDRLGDHDLLGAHAVEHRGHGPACQIQHGKGHGHAPKRRNRQLPAKEQRRHEHDGACDDGAPEFSQHMAVGMLHSLNVAHDGFG